MKHKVINWGRRGGSEVQIIKEWTPTEEGMMAIDFAHHFAIVAAVEDGEDKAGRAKLRLQSADEVVQRSCEIAEKLVAEMRKRKWILDLPMPTAPEPPQENLPPDQEASPEG